MKYLILLAALALPGFFSQQLSVPDKLTGTWESPKDGDVTAVLSLNQTGDQLKGTVTLRNLSSGNDKVTLELTIADTQFNGTVLSFKLVFPEPEKMTTDWEFRLNGDNEASLTALKENGQAIEDAPSFSMKRVRAN